MESIMKSKKFMMIVAAMTAMVCIAKETRAMEWDCGC